LKNPRLLNKTRIRIAGIEREKTYAKSWYKEKEAGTDWNEQFAA
jgi:hypothetical protein